MFKYKPMFYNYKSCLPKNDLFNKNITSLVKLIVFKDPSVQGLEQYAVHKDKTLLQLKKAADKLEKPINYVANSIYDIKYNAVSENFYKLYRNIKKKSITKDELKDFKEAFFHITFALLQDKIPAKHHLYTFAKYSHYLKRTNVHELLNEVFNKLNKTQYHQLYPFSPILNSVLAEHLLAIKYHFSGLSYVINKPKYTGILGFTKFAVKKFFKIEFLSTKFNPYSYAIYHDDENCYKIHDLTDSEDSYVRNKFVKRSKIYYIRNLFYYSIYAHTYILKGIGWCVKSIFNLFGAEGKGRLAYDIICFPNKPIEIFANIVNNLISIAEYFAVGDQLPGFDSAIGQFSTFIKRKINKSVDAEKTKAKQVLNEYKYEKSYRRVIELDIERQVAKRQNIES